MGKLGWDLPPGVTHRMIEEQVEDRPCAVCARMPDGCVCPECPACGQTGAPPCYHAPGHGLRLSREQVVGRMTARVAMVRQHLLEEEEALQHVIGGGEFSDDLADNPDPWR